MMKNTFALAALGLIGMAALAPTGCAPRGERITLRSEHVAISLRLPPGWVEEDRTENSMVIFSEEADPENRGSITIYPADGKDLAAWTDDLLKQSAQMAALGEALGKAVEHLAGEQAGAQSSQAFAQKLVSRTQRKVGSRDAIELVEESGGKKVITVLVKEGDEVWVTFFASRAGRWEDNEPLFRRSLDSLSLR